jgi:2-polyprenyl-3-methyl-5-hydroxy-6-metoxy-1,4-benzoquinol methylase
MFGLGGSFSYVQCSNCKTLRIRHVPENIADYYQPFYHGTVALLPDMLGNPIKRWLIEARDKFELTGRGLAGELIASRKAAMDLRLVRPLQMKQGESILDVGCGQGRIIARMLSLGVIAHGVDPFIDADIGSEASGFWVRKGYLEDISQRYDAILMNHSFEHMPDPEHVLLEVRKRLNPTGRMLLRIPTISCEMWDRYGDRWYQLDAPRHYFLHSRRGIAMLADRTGWRIEKVIDDSEKHQFVGSELYRMECPLNPLTEEGKHRREELISQMDMAAFEEETKRLNAAGRGDQIAVLMRPK